MMRWNRRTWYGALLCVLMLATPGLAQPSEADLRQEIEALKQGQRAIQNELREIKQLLRGQRAARPEAPNVNDLAFDLRDTPVKGADTAMLTLIEFTDYQ